MSRYAGVQDIYEALAQKGLLESQGHQVFPKDVTPGAESAQGVLYSRSLFSDMEVAVKQTRNRFTKRERTTRVHSSRSLQNRGAPFLRVGTWMRTSPGTSRTSCSKRLVKARLCGVA